MNKELREWALLFFPTRGDQIAAKYRDGASVEDIALELGVNKRSIARYLTLYTPTPAQLEKFKRDHVRAVLASRPEK